MGCRGSRKDAGETVWESGDGGIGSIIKDSTGLDLIAYSSERSGNFCR
jgi:restriction endonuclease Mrr